MIRQPTTTTTTPTTKATTRLTRFELMLMYVDLVLYTVGYDYRVVGGDLRRNGMTLELDSVGDVIEGTTTAVDVETIDIMELIALHEEENRYG